MNKPEARAAQPSLPKSATVGQALLRTKTRRNIISAGVGSAGALLLAACSVPGQAASPAGASTAKTVKPAKLTLLEAVTPDKEDEYRRTLLDSFTAKYSQISVELIIPAKAERGSKLLTMAAAGTPPDVSKGDQAYYEPYVKGIIHDLRQYLKNTKLPWSDFDEAARVSFTDPTKGAVYALPNSVSVEAIFYNVEAFQKAGVPEPPADKNDAKWTWDEYADRAVKLTRRADEANTMFGSVDLGELKWTGPWMYKGGEWWDKGYTKSLLDKDPSSRGWQYRQDLAWRHRASPKPDEAPLTAGGFGAGKYAMSLDGTWSISTLLKSPPIFKWNLGHVPVSYGYGTNDARVNPFFPDCFAMASDQQRDQTWLLLEHLEEEPQLLFYNLDYRNTIPPRKGLVPRYTEALSKSAPGVNWKVLVDAVSYSHPQTQRLVKNFDAMKKEYEGALATIMKNEKTAQQACQELAPVLTRMLTQG